MSARRYLHTSVPGPLLPLYALLRGRRACCGVPWRHPHLDGCRRRPWVSRGDGLLRTPSAGTPPEVAARIEEACVAAHPLRRRPVSGRGAAAAR